MKTRRDWMEGERKGKEKKEEREEKKVIKC